MEQTTAADALDVERCKACGEPFTALEARMSWTVPHWVIPQIIGPIHQRCQRWPAAQQDALDKVLSAVHAARSEARSHG